MNKALFIGRLVEVPELKETANKKSYTRVTIAVNRRFKSENGEREADFLTTVFWGKRAENFVSYVKKGTLLSVDGEIRTRRYKDKEDKTHYVTEILGLSYDILESKAAIALRTGEDVTDELELEGEELPF